MTSVGAIPGKPRPLPEAAGRALRTGFLGSLEYAAATRLQDRLRADLIAGRGDEHLLLLEHPHVYTLGRNADRGEMVAAESWLEERGVTVAESDRGGRITYHGPGQLVGYPIVDLNPDRRDIRRYVCDLQETLVRTLADFSIEGEPGLPDRPAGVWVGHSKIASIGVHLRRWITTHGFALNVCTDISYFGGIVPCGIQGVQMTSMRLLGATARPAEVAPVLAGHFCDVFERRPMKLEL